MTAIELAELLWRDFRALAPQAQDVRYLLASHGEIVRSDRIALRGFGVRCSGVDLGLDALARPFAQRGWQLRERHQDRDRHLRARTWRHDDPALPELVISEIAVEELSPEAQAVIAALVGQLPPGFGARDDLAWAGRPWVVSHAQYTALAAESEHAAWVAAFGFRVHRIAVDLGALSTFPDLAALAAFFVEHGFRVEDRGAIRRSASERVERMAMRPDGIAIGFADATVAIPGARYEFTQRSAAPGGELRHGQAPSAAAAPAMGTT